MMIKFTVDAYYCTGAKPILPQAQYAGIVRDKDFDNDGFALYTVELTIEQLVELVQYGDVDISSNEGDEDFGQYAPYHLFIGSR